MTAISLQAERLGDTALSAEAHDRLGVLQRGIERGRALLEQLLAYASVQSVEPALPASSGLRLAVRQVLEDLLPLAEAKHIDIGLEGEEDALVAISETDLRTGKAVSAIHADWTTHPNNPMRATA